MDGLQTEITTEFRSVLDYMIKLVTSSKSGFSAKIVEENGL